MKSKMLVDLDIFASRTGGIIIPATMMGLETLCRIHWLSLASSVKSAAQLQQPQDSLSIANPVPKPIITVWNEHVLNLEAKGYSTFIFI